MPLTPDQIGRRIAQAREELGWTQVDLAVAAHVTPGTIHRWEKGKLPSVSELIRLADVLGKPADYLTEPPERQVELVDLTRKVDDVLRLLEERRELVERLQEALVESLAAIHDRLVRIEEQQSAPVDESSEHR